MDAKNELNKEISDIKNKLESANSDLQNLTYLKDKMKSGVDNLKNLSDQNVAFQNSLTEIILKLSNLADPLQNIVEQNTNAFKEINKKHADIKEMIGVQHKEFSKLLSDLKNSMIITFVLLLASVSVLYFY
tara:strand:- start:196 stop:588 length:393 start_codon:yes stop_codon:yes gene_type:complete